MKFKLDENPPASAAATLASAGHDADTVITEHLAGAPDPDVVTAGCEQCQACRQDYRDWARLETVARFLQPVSR